MRISSILADDHRRRRRILRPECCGRRRLLGRRFGVGGAPAGRRQKSCHRATPAAARNAGRRCALTAAAALPLGRAGHLADNLAGLRIVFADRVLSDVDEPLAVHIHAVPLRRIERTDDVAALVEVNHRRRPDAAARQRRRQLGVELDVREIVRAVQHPDVVVPVDGKARDAAHLPLVGQRFGPVGIELVARRGRCLRGQADTQGKQAEAERDGKCPAPCVWMNMLGHGVSSHPEK